MFKIFFGKERCSDGNKAFSWALLWILFGIGCRSLPPLAPVNLNEPGWTVREGQAVWRAKKDAPEIAGEILLGTAKDGRTFVQFTKTPFPFVIARTETNSWQIESPTQNKRFAGPGHPPNRIIWFHLPSALSGKSVPRLWSWEPKNDQWHLENKTTGESLDGYFQR